jgi:hypothetical protein
MLALSSSCGAEFLAPLELAISQCGLFTDLADDLRSEAEDKSAVRIDVPVTSAGVKGLADFVAAPGGLEPLDSRGWADGEVAARFPNHVHSVLGPSETLASGGVDTVIEVMCAADFVRNDGCLAFWANYLASRLAQAAPAEVKTWCGADPQLSSKECASLSAMHRLLLEQKL